jgi:hypothetical protein
MLCIQICDNLCYTSSITECLWLMLKSLAHAAGAPVSKQLVETSGDMSNRSVSLVGPELQTYLQLSRFANAVRRAH